MSRIACHPARLTHCVRAARNGRRRKAPVVVKAAPIPAMESDLSDYPGALIPAQMGW